MCIWVYRWNTDSLRSFVSWLGAHGLQLRLLVEEILSSRISVFFALDVMVSAVVVVVFTGVEGERMKLRFRWTLLPALLLVGVSLALPLLLYLRESALDESRAHALASGAE
jgi:Terpene cyclase DEP1